MVYTLSKPQASVKPPSNVFPGMPQPPLRNDTTLQDQKTHMNDRETISIAKVFRRRFMDFSRLARAKASIRSWFA